MDRRKFFTAASAATAGCLVGNTVNAGNRVRDITLEEYSDKNQNVTIFRVSSLKNAKLQESFAEFNDGTNTLYRELELSASNNVEEIIEGIEKFKTWIEKEVAEHSFYDGSLIFCVTDGKKYCLFGNYTKNVIRTQEKPGLPLDRFVIQAETNYGTKNFLCSVI